MEAKYRSGPTGRGGWHSSAIPRFAFSDVERSVGGLFLRGVVITTYKTEARPQKVTTLPKSNRNPLGRPIEVSIDPVSVSCDVLVYSSLPKHKRLILMQVPVMQAGGGLHTGDIWAPRPATMVIDGALSTDLARIEPSSLDGDHVVIGFLDESQKLPIIIGSIPHPARDVGNDQKTNSQGTKLVAADAYPRMHKHNGAVWGVDGDGDFRIDLTRAHGGLYDAKGREARLNGDPTDAGDLTFPEAGEHGNLHLRLRKGSTCTVSVESDPANETATSNQIALISVQDNRVTLAANILGDGSGNPSIIEIDENGITIDAKNDTGTVTVKGTTQNVETDTVNLGDGASHPVIKGDDWQAAHGSYDAAISSLFGLITAIWAAMVADGVVAPSHVTTLPLLSGWTVAAGPHLATVSTALAPPVLLSSDVKTR